jgi:hypothetical protein
MQLWYDFEIRDNDGNLMPGLTPAFIAGGLLTIPGKVSLPLPTIIEIGNGTYAYPFDSELNGPTSGTINVYDGPTPPVPLAVSRGVCRRGGVSLLPFLGAKGVARPGNGSGARRGFAGFRNGPNEQRDVSDVTYAASRGCFRLFSYRVGFALTPIALFPFAIRATVHIFPGF